MLPPPPPVPAAPRVPYARVTALRTALLRRLLPPLACLGRPPSGAALRSAVAPHKGQVQRLAWTPRGGGGAPPSAEGGCQTEGKTCRRAGAFWRAATGRRPEHNIEKAPARTCGKGASLNFCARGSCCPRVGWRGRGGGSKRGRCTFFGRPSRPPLPHGPWPGPGPRWAGIAGRCSGLRHPFPHHDALRSWAGPTTTRTGCGVDELVWRALDPLTVNTKGSAAWRPKTPSSARLLPPWERGVCTGEPPT